MKERTIEAFIKTIEQASSWFITGGGLNVPDWEEVCRDRQKKLQGEGPDSFPPATFSLWQLVIDALLTDRVKVKWEVEAAKEVLQEIQGEETCLSRCSLEDQEGERGTR